MVLSALWGAVGFLTRVPVGVDADDWRAFSSAPWAFPVVGTGIGLVLSAPLVALGSLDRPALAATAFLAIWLLLLGITHLDGVADLGDAAVIHGDSEARVEVLKDSDVGVGAATALGVALLGTTLAAFSLADTGGPAQVVAVVLTAEVGAKTAMAAVACLGEARHEGLGSQFTDWNRPRDLVPVALVVVGVGFALWLFAPTTTPVAAATLVGALAGATLVARWATRLIDGVSGDVFGAVDVVARLTGLFIGAALVGGAV